MIGTNLYRYAILIPKHAGNKRVFQESARSSCEGDTHPFLNPRGDKKSHRNRNPYILHIIQLLNYYFEEHLFGFEVGYFHKKNRDNL